MRPIVTLLTDFGSRDSYVAEMKGTLLAACPQATIVDVTHDIPPQDVASASLVLERTIGAFPDKTIHIAVVDPGVGSERRLLKCRLNGQTLLLPDNGLITWTYRRHPALTVHELAWRPGQASATFHGRDVLVPAAVRLIENPSWLAGLSRAVEPVLLDQNVATTPGGGRIIAVDHFGNAITNFTAEWMAWTQSAWTGVTINGRRVAIGRTYANVPPGEPVALVNSGGLLEIAVNGGSAARSLSLSVGTDVSLS